ncbi:MAG: hypothetical protein QOF20_932 [Acidimicrobiaceae bacterium]|jgi:hypothetical protein|nr:hypothetical protein [Acidimicrobiaceae bacterium]MDQ1376601.1 hypothetical protein [Acidimicrobiaceae bacterium]
MSDGISNDRVDSIAGGALLGAAPAGDTSGRG